MQDITLEEREAIVSLFRTGSDVGDSLCMQNSLLEGKLLANFFMNLHWREASASVSRIVHCKGSWCFLSQESSLEGVSWQYPLQDFQLEGNLILLPAGAGTPLSTILHERKASASFWCLFEPKTLVLLHDYLPERIKLQHFPDSYR